MNEAWRTTPVRDIPVVWEDPPAAPLYRSPTHWRGALLDQFRRELAVNQGKWALLPLDGLDDPRESTLKTHTRSINKGLSGWSEGCWEAKYSNGKVYVRKSPDTKA